MRVSCLCFALRSEAMSSELSLQIEDLRGMVDLNARKSEKDDESIKLLIDEKIKSKVTTVKTQLEDQLKGLEWEVGNLRDSFALRSEAMSSELSLQIDDLKSEIDLNVQKGKKENESIKLILTEKVESAISSVKTDVNKKLNGFEYELTSQKNFFNDQTKNISSELGVQIENLKSDVDSNAQKSEKQNKSIQLILNEKIESTVLSAKTDVALQAQLDQYQVLIKR